MSLPGRCSKNMMELAYEGERFLFSAEVVEKVVPAFRMFLNHPSMVGKLPERIRIL